MAERRQIPGVPGHTIDADGCVRRAVRADGRVYQCLVPAIAGVVSLVTDRGATTTKVSTLMAAIWPEIAGPASQALQLELALADTLPESLIDTGDELDPCYPDGDGSQAPTPED